MGTSEHSEHIKARYQCLDCDAQKSTQETVRCWDCSLKAKKANWQSEASRRAKEILGKRDAGMTMVEIARELGISRQRAYQVVESAGLSARRDTRGGSRKVGQNGNG
jgi:ribosomal protein L37AE/L43A